MTNRVEYARDNHHIAIVTKDDWDESTPFWVYYNNKIACKFSDKSTAQAYVKVLLREG